MDKDFNDRATPRIVHYFRDVDLFGSACPEFVPESFPSYCQPDDEAWSAGLLLRIALRMKHLWPTYGIRDGRRTIQGEHPAVCFANFNLADLIAVRDGFRPQDGVVTRYAITFPLKIALEGGIQPVIQWSSGKASLLDGSSLEGMAEHDADNQYRYVSDDPGTSWPPTGYPEWRWRYPRSYRRIIRIIEEDGFEGGVIPGLNLTDTKWSGIGIVVPDMPTARLLQYDILTLIDQGLVSESHFDHILVCDQLPVSLEGLSEEQLQMAFSKACFDFKSCMEVSSEAAAAQDDFRNRLAMLDASTPKQVEREHGGCWLWFQDNDQPYVRALIKAGRVKPNLKGRYLASLWELSMVHERRDLLELRDLRNRQDIALALSKKLEEKHGLRSTYFSVWESYSPNDDPAYAGKIWGGGYFILPQPEEDEDEEEEGD